MHSGACACPTARRFPSPPPPPDVDLIDDYRWEPSVTEHGRPKWALQEWDDQIRSWGAIGYVSQDEHGMWWSWKPDYKARCNAQPVRFHNREVVLPPPRGQSDSFRFLDEAAEHLASLNDVEAGEWQDARRRKKACVNAVNRAMQRTSIPSLLVGDDRYETVDMDVEEDDRPGGQWEDWVAFADAIIAAERGTHYKPADPDLAPILHFFRYDHLPSELQQVSAPIGELAHRLAAVLPDGEEKTAALRKLLEAKDAAVRARL